MGGYSVVSAAWLNGTNVNASQVCIGNDCKTAWPTGGAGWTTSGNYVYNNTSGVMVGIGTSSPNYLLEIANNSKALNVSGVLFVNGTSGNVGIGTTTPSQKLEVNGKVKVTGTGTELSPSDGVLDVLGSVNASSYVYGSQLCIGTDCRSSWPAGGGGTGAGWAASGSNVYNDTAGVKVGIGTAAPVKTLDVVGVINTTQGMNVTSGTLTFGSAANGQIYWDSTNSRLVIKVI
jgi:hypothetical protein